MHKVYVSNIFFKLLINFLYLINEINLTAVRTLCSDTDNQKVFWRLVILSADEKLNLIHHNPFVQDVMIEILMMLLKSKVLKETIAGYIRSVLEIGSILFSGFNFEKFRFFTK